MNMRRLTKTLTILTILTGSLLLAGTIPQGESQRYFPYVEVGQQVATTTPTVTLTPRPTLGASCEVVVAGLDKRHIWHIIPELQAVFGVDAYLTGTSGGTEIGLGVSARQPACDALATLYRDAGFEAEVRP